MGFGMDDMVERHGLGFFAKNSLYFDCLINFQEFAVYSLFFDCLIIQNMFFFKSRKFFLKLLVSVETKQGGFGNGADMTIAHAERGCQPKSRSFVQFWKGNFLERTKRKDEG